MMSFEDLLTPVPPKCKTCAFIANLDPELREQVAAAVSKPVYSDEMIAKGMKKIETAYNSAPGRIAVKTHRERGHA